MAEPGGGAMAEGLPGAEPHPAQLVEHLAGRRAERGAAYRPRTRHLRPDGEARYTNRLFLETSPYLLQHAHNPVNWYPWGDEAFETARRLGRPVLLSVGYSTCHWCHVMEEESFEDEGIAALLNQGYVAVKVDREERPDVDAVYMSAVVAMTGQGGWPMTVWLNPDREPFYGGTYFPPHDHVHGRPGFRSVLAGLAEVYAREPGRAREAARSLREEVEARLAPALAAGRPPGPEVLRDAAAFYGRRFDGRWGGLGGAPKFPSSLPVRFLLRYWRRTGDEQALHMARLSLDRMAEGGIHDHVGGGFHRYSTDERWLVPHFEKMLYDNALLVMAYLEGWQATGQERYREVVRRTLGWVEREMTAPEGGFYSATDADSLTPAGEREEGRFFTWTPAELVEVLGAGEGRRAAEVYGVSEGGSFEGRSILHLRGAFEAADGLEEARERLYAARARRPPPLRDDKVLASWNGLMISALARAALVLGDPDHARRAGAAARFVLEGMRDGDGRLLRSFKDGSARHRAYLDDHAFLCAGLLDLFEATGEPGWLAGAIALDRVLEERFEDREAGGFFTTGHDHERLLAREKPMHDGAEPSGNSVAALNLLRLAALTGRASYRDRAERALGVFGPLLERAPAVLSELLLALDFALDSPRQVVLVAPRERQEAAPFLDALRPLFLPSRVLVVAAEGTELDRLAALVPLVRGRVAKDGRATAYVCEGGTCRLPVTEPGEMVAELRRVEPL